MATSVTKAGLKAASDKVIVALDPVIEELKDFCTDFSPDFAKKGDAVAVEVLSAVTEDFDPANGKGFAHGTNKIAPATITLNKHKKSTFSIGDGDALDNELDPVWDKLSPLSAQAVGNDIIGDVYGLPTVAKAESKITQATHASLGDFMKIYAALVNLKKYQPKDCVLVLTPGAYADLIEHLPASVIGDGNAIKGAVVGAYLGFKSVRVSPNVSTTSNAYGYIVPTGAIGVAARYFKPTKPGGNLLEAGTITSEKTGLVMGTRVVVDADAGETFWTVDCQYGCGLTKDTSNGAPGFLAIVTA